MTGIVGFLLVAGSIFASAMITLFVLVALGRIWHWTRRAAVAVERQYPPQPDKE